MAKLSKLKRIVLVAGMHRSGTSATSRLLNLLGVQLPGDLIQPTADNPRGFWENARIVAFHERLHEAAGGVFYDLFSISDSWLQSEQARHAVEELTAILKEDFAEYDLSLVKDPRLSRFLPLWYEAAQRAGLSPLTLIPVRQPLEVAASLMDRQGMARAQGLMLWLEHAIAAETASRGHPRSFVTFETIVQDWRAAARKIARDLDLVWPNKYEKVAADVDAFLTDDLWHHRGEDSGALPDHRVGALCRRAWAIVGKLVDNEKDADAQQELTQIDIEFREYAAPAAEITNALQAQLAELNRKLIEFDQLRVTWYEPQLNTRQQEIERLGAVLEKIRSDEFQPEIDRLKAAIAEAERHRSMELEPELKRQQAAIQNYEKLKREWYEPQLESRQREIERLTAEVENHRTIVRQLEADNKVLTAKLASEERPFLHRRILYHAEQAQRLATVLHQAEAQAAEVTRIRDTWYVPELVRLNEVISGYEKTKREWFEPQLASRAAHISQLQEELHAAQMRLASMEGFANSRSFRLWRKLRRVLRLRG